MKYFDESFLTVHWVPDGNIVWAEWKTAARGENLRRGATAGLELLVQKQSSRWLGDTRFFLETIDPLDVKWVNDHWMPRVVEAGLRSMAFVMPTKVITQIQLKSFIATVNGHELASAYFDDVDAAWAWLRSQS